MKNVLKILFFGSITLLFVRCTLSTYISSQYDDVLNIERHRYDATFNKNERNEQTYSQNISILKERNNNGEMIYTMYDIISLPYESFNLSDKMYIVIDKKVIELNNKTLENGVFTKFDEETSSIMKADSSKVDVVTGYSEQHLKTYKMTRILDSEIIERISGAKDVYLRYYAGPNLITSEIKSYKLGALKRMIQKNYK
ncbi:MAG: hypothetical protein JXR27_08095 [Paludibacteraceae bacterium]|nr:hypothetical protein [Paludibacteraceae bacterium]